MKKEMNKFNESNFFQCTQAKFESCEKPESEPDYWSNSGSKYWYTDEGVIRYSDHWGLGVASCDWFFGDQDEDDLAWLDCDGWRAGFCKWDDFKIADKDITVYDKTKTFDIESLGTPFDEGVDYE